MKYIIELLRGNKIYPDKLSAIKALDNYNNHRVGQPVVVIYKKQNKKRALLAIGTGTGQKEYTIIGDVDGSIDITSSVSARDVILDEIDYKGLLEDLSNEYKDSGLTARFGWLGVEGHDKWIETKKIPSGTSVQEAFEAILCGNTTPIEPDPVIKYISINEPITYTGNYDGTSHKERIKQTIKSAISGIALGDNIDDIIEINGINDIINASTGEISGVTITIKTDKQSEYQFEGDTTEKEITVNYTISPIDVTVTITGNTNTKTYNGDLQTVTGYTATTNNQLYDVESYFTFSGTASASRTDVGTTNMGLTANQFTNTNTNFATVTFNVIDGYQTINPKPATVSIKGDTPVAPGISLETYTINGSGFIGEDFNDVDFVKKWTFGGKEYTEDKFTEVGIYTAIPVIKPEYEDKYVNYNITYNSLSVTVEEQVEELKITYTTGSPNKTIEEVIDNNKHYITETIEAKSFNDTFTNVSGGYSLKDEIKGEFKQQISIDGKYDDIYTSDGIDNKLSDIYIIYHCSRQGYDTEQWPPVPIYYYPTTIKVNRNIDDYDINIYEYDTITSKWSISNIEAITDVDDNNNIIITINFTDNLDNIYGLEIKEKNS